MPNVDFDFGVSHAIPALKFAIIPGDSAGKITCTGINLKDTLLAVNAFGFDADGDAEASSVDMLSKTTITADDEITTVTTDTTDLMLFIAWIAAATGA